MELVRKSETWGVRDQRWLRSRLSTEMVQGVMLDLTDSNWVPATHWPSGALLSGLPLKAKSGTEGRYRLFIPADLTIDAFVLSGGLQVPSPVNDDVAVDVITFGVIRLNYLPVSGITASFLGTRFQTTLAGN